MAQGVHEQSPTNLALKIIRAFRVHLQLVPDAVSDCGRSNPTYIRTGQCHEGRTCTVESRT
eukprot:3437362-Prorocentrum_lima.AAC.1